MFVLGILVLSTWLSLGLLVARWIMGGHRVYGFLIWNLFLAWIPFWIAAAMYYGHLRQTKRNVLMLSLGAMWLLFFPNAPYLWTDLKHLPMTGHDPVWWCDLVMALSFGWNGMLLGLVSMYMVHRIARDRLGVMAGWLIAIGALGLGSLGISLGRFNRSNSWDLFTKPDALLGRMVLQLSHPFEHPLLFGMASLFFVFLLLAYITLLALMAMGREEGSSLIDERHRAGVSGS
ncbi:MAG TPA: DUF1361 domain-containing protein [Humisphaera sp.]|nr:DUF1361 domain-containing protein [Humisphaera sp.]